MGDNAYKGLVRLTSGITQRGDNNYPLVNAPDIQVDDTGKRLDEKLRELDASSGIIFTPSVSQNGDLSWTNNKGVDNPETVNIKGEPGTPGSVGPMGSVFEKIELTDGAADVDAVAGYRVKIDIIEESITNYEYPNTYSTWFGSRGCAAVGTKIYLFGGYGNNTLSNKQKQIDVWDTTTNSVSTLSTSLPVSSSDISAASVGTKVYLFYATSNLEKIYVFDTETEAFTDLNITNSDCNPRGAASIGTKIYLACAYDGGSEIRLWVFDTETSSLTKTDTIIPMGEDNTLDHGSYSTKQIASIGTDLYLFESFRGVDRSNDCTKLVVYDTVHEKYTDAQTIVSVALVDYRTCTIGKDIYLTQGQYYTGAISKEAGFYIYHIESAATTLVLTYTNGAYTFPFDLYDEYCNYFDFEILGLKLNDAKTELSIAYKLNGQRDLITITGSNFDLTDCKLSITGAEQVLQYNTTSGEGMNGSIFELDTTLTEEGKAADAKAVGDRLAEINAQLDVDITLTESGKAADAKAVGDKFIETVLNLTPLSSTPNIPMEIGNIDITHRGWDYTNEYHKDMRVRLPERYTLKLERGDTIGLKDYTDARFYIGYRIGNDYYYTGWLTNDYIASQACECTVLISNITDVVQSSPNELGGLLFVKKAEKAEKAEKAQPIKILSINHRGFNTVAPENTLPAYKLSKKNGFDFVECDIRFTADGVPVLLHDNSINRTARNVDGSNISETIKISDITYEQALSYDFGIWKSDEYAGTKIPTLTEYLILCRALSLHPYLDIYECSATKAQIICNAVIACGMMNNVTFITSNSLFEPFKYIAPILPKARYGLVTWRAPDHITQNVSQMIDNLRSYGVTNIFVDIDMNECDIPTYVSVCKEKGVALEVYAPNTETEILTLDPFITGITSDKLNAEEVLYKANIE